MAQLRAAEAAHRQAEFARARAEAIATARGEALMHAQEATREAQAQQAQLEELLQLACERLGLEVVPTPGPAPDQSPLVTPVPAGGGATTPLAVRQSIFSGQQLAVVAASLSKLPRPPMSWRGGADLEQQLQRVAEEADEQENRRSHHQQQQARDSRERERAAAEAKRASRRSSRGGSLPASQGGSAAAGAPSGGSEHVQPLSGFTVYTNSLQATEDAGAGDHGEVVQRPPPRASQGLRGAASAPASVAGDAVGERDSQGSGVAWRSISSAALSSRSLGSEPEQQREAEEEPTLEQRARRSRQPRHGSLQASRELEPAAMAASVGDWGQQQADRLAQHAHQLSKLVAPGMQASQVLGWRCGRRCLVSVPSPPSGT